MNLPDPASFESLEALQARNAKEADQAQIDARIAEFGIDYDGAKDMMYGDLEVPSEDEITKAQREEAQEEDPDEILTALDGDNISNEDGKEVIIGEAGRDTLNEDIETLNMPLSIDEDPMSPLVNRLMDGRFIGSEVGVEIKTRLSQGENFRDIISGNKLSSPIPEQYQQYLIGRDEEINHSDEGLVERNTDSFKNDFSQNLENLGKSKTLSEDRIEDIIGQIGQVYLTGGKAEEKEAAFEMAIATAINTQFDAHKTSFHRTVEFEVLFENVKNPDISFKERIEAYSDILDLLYTDTGAKGGKRNRENEAMIRKLQLKNSGLQERFETAMQKLQKSREENNKIKIDSLLKDIEKIKQETREVLDTPIGNFNIALDGEKQQSENPQKAA